MSGGPDTCPVCGALPCDWSASGSGPEAFSAAITLLFVNGILTDSERHSARRRLSKFAEQVRA